MVAFFQYGGKYAKIQLFEVDNNYIQYLQQFDNKVLNHYGVNYVKNRKYLRILIHINDCGSPIIFAKSKDRL